MVNNNTYYDRMVHEVQTVLNCDKDKAMEIVTIVSSMGGNPAEFVHRSPGLMGTPEPDADALLSMLQDIRKVHNMTNYLVCFPEGYENREARRRAKRKTKGKTKIRKL